MAPPKAIRHVGCTKIDFVGHNKAADRRDLEVTLQVASRVANAKQHGAPKNKDELQQYCKKRDWLNAHASLERKCDDIPLMGTIPQNEKQFVFGRMSNLGPYYACPDKFITLDSQDWDGLYQVNDMFVYCATQTTKASHFPIRIVFDTTHGVHSKDDKLGFMNYDDHVLTIPHLLAPAKRIHILSREICQISHYFGMHLYQSVEHPSVFFASKHAASGNDMKKKLKTYKLRPVVIS